MDPRKLFVDERLTGMCVYCGGLPETRDHIPSRVLLDEPFPDNLPVVDACRACNGSFSQDEEYVACLIESAVTGSCEPSGVKRRKIQRILKEWPALAAMIGKSRRENELGPVWTPDFPRVRNILLKLAQGHLAFELSLPVRGDPDVVEFSPLICMTPAQRAAFEAPLDGGEVLWPEIGSRAFLECFLLGGTMLRAHGWKHVQEKRYRYRVAQARGGDLVQIVLSEYLACRVVWS